jgi:hypothetical protein
MVLPGTNLSLSNARAPTATLDALLVLAVLVLVVVTPAFSFLLWLQGQQLLTSEESEPTTPLIEPPIPSRGIAMTEINPRQDVTFASTGGLARDYLRRPASGSDPGPIVIGEWWDLGAYRAPKDRRQVSTT